MSARVAIITASSTGIGKAIAFRLSQEGVTVIISSRSKEHVDSTVKEIISRGGNAHGIVCHVAKKSDRTHLIQETIRKFGKINFVIANAAVSTQMGNFLEAEESQLDKMWQINYKSTFFLIKQATPHLLKNPAGESSIVIVASYAAHDLPTAIGHYAITKTALVAMTKILAKELQNDEIRVNCVAPGLIKTKFSGSLWENGEKEAAEGMGVKRLGVPEDIANVVNFMLSGQAAYMTGECVVVAGRPSSRL